MKDERKTKSQLIEELENLRRQQGMLLESTSDAIITTDLNFIIQGWNTASESLYGWSAVEALGRRMQDVVPTETHGHDTDDAEAKLLDDGQWAGEAVQTRKNGEKIRVHTAVNLIKDEADRPTGIVAINRDITYRKQAEKDKARLAKQLQHAQKMEAIGRLAGGVAHDFNNVLCAITGHASLLLNGLSSEDPLQKPLQQISKAADQAADLTQRLLTFSRKQLIEPKVINLSNLIEGLQPMLSQVIRENIILKSLFQEDIGQIRADPNQVEQILLTLVINARDAMPDGGTLTLETTAVSRVDDYSEKHPTTRSGTHILLEVSDTGCGMSDEIREKIFEPFYTTKAVGLGTGLGLSSVYGIVEQCAGKIEVASEPGKGTSFKIYFPRVLDKPDRLIRPTAPEPAGGQETVLVVEDEAMVLSLAVEILENRGYHVLAASLPDDALILAKQHASPIDLLLTDVVMPQMNGRELAEKLTELHPEIKVLYTSGYAQNVIAHHGILDEGLHFIAKPYSLKTLAARLCEVLDRTE